MAPTSNKNVPESIDAYIADFAPDVQAALEQVRAAVRKAAPKATEVISYGMPAFKQNGYLVFFAAFKKHIGFYGNTTAANEKHKTEVAPYIGAKGSLRFPLDEPMPLSLIGKIVKLRVKEDAARAKARKAKKAGA
jgi:uncharacterized protein YdhG (YjbR/CyaY superfamily)